MTRYVIRRLLLALVTLWLVSVIVFMTAQVLPGSVARTILGPAAPEAAVQVLNARLGLDRPLLTQYLDWIGGVVRGDFGTSYGSQRPVSEYLWPALWNSIKLGLVAFLIVVPLGLGLGVLAALRQRSLLDRSIVVGGMTSAALPEFVTGLSLILVFAIWLPIFPVSATAPPGSGIVTQLWHLVLPAIPLALLLFGYFARIARSGMIEVLQSDFVRTATLKGMRRRTVVRRHALRNALLPSITVIATQLSYMVGGMVVIETLFRYRGIGSLVLDAARDKDLPMLEAGVLVMAALVVLAALVADVLVAALNPRIRLGASE